MQKITIETGGQPTEVVVDGKSATFGPVPPSGGSGSSGPKPDAVPVMVNPGAQADLGNGGNGGSGGIPVGVATNVPVGVSFTIREDAKNERKLRWEGHPGQFWDHNSWAIFDSSGNRALSADNAVVVGTLGFTLDNSVLMQLGAGQYFLGVAVNAPGTLAFVFVQS